MSFPNVIFGTPGMEFITNSTTVGQGQNSLGTQMIFADGRKFRWGQQNASTAAVVGDVEECPVPVSNHILQTLSAAAAVGDTSVAVVLGNTAAAADAYRDGYLAIELGTGFGYNYQIRSHAAVAASGTFTVPLAGNQSVQVAIPTTANTVSLIPNKFKLVLVAATTPVSGIAGVAVKPVVVSGFGWYATRGPALVSTVTAVPVIGQPCGVINTTAGAVSVCAAATTAVVGICMHPATTTNKSLIDLTLD